MKIPISFGTKLFFRVLFPGLLLAAILSRFTYATLSALEQANHFAIVFPVQAIIIGCLFVALDMPIYMVFEGRRFWPKWAFRLGTCLEFRRLRGLHSLAYGETKGKGSSKIAENKDRLEAALEASHFPMNRRKLVPTVMWPTRIGNLIAAYEQYPLIKYGMDSVFFWPRIWVTIDSSLREEIDNQQALVDGLVYSVVALVLALPIGIAYGVVDFTCPGLLAYDVGSWWYIGAGVALAFLAAIVYRLSLFLHASFGETFKATFDQHRSKLDFAELTVTLSHLYAEPRFVKRSEYSRNLAIWRLLRWQKYRPQGADQNRTARLK